MRFAVINPATDIVEAIIEAEPGFLLPDRALIATDTAGIGWTWTGTTFQPPLSAAPPVPDTVSKLWLVRVLRAVGLFASIRTFIASLSSDIQEDWTLSSEIARSDPLVETARQALGMTPAKIDAIFRAAATASRAQSLAPVVADLEAAGFVVSI